MKTLLPLLRRPLLHVALFSFCVNLLLLAPALFMLQVFDRVLASRSEATLIMLLVGMAVALGLMLALDYLRSRLQGVIGALLADRLSPLVAKLTLARSASRSERVPAEGQRDIGTLRSLFSAQGLLALFDVPWAVVYIAVIWLAHPLLGVLALAAAALMLGLAAITDWLTRRGIDELQQQAAQATRYLETSMQNAEAVQAMGMTDALLARWQAMNARVGQLQQPMAGRAVGMAALTRMARQAVQVLMQALGAWLVISGEGSAGILIACTILLGRALAPVEQVVGSWRVLAEGRGAFRRLAALLAEQAAEPQRMDLPAPRGQLVAHGLAYRPPGSDRPLISGVSLSLEAGESLAIIGPSGAGKSTLARVLAGLWAPSAGSLRLDHADLAQWPRAQLGPWLGYVPQDVQLFPGTVADNIARLGAVDSARVVDAAQRAGVHTMILGLPQGYDTPVEAMGVLLSPGQRQRIALARALYGDPRLLILDEPNANLDGGGELALAEALVRLKGKVTVIAVTHRTSLVQPMDKLLVLDGGKVQHYGPTAEVLRAMQEPARKPQVVAMARAGAETVLREGVA